MRNHRGSPLWTLLKFATRVSAMEEVLALESNKRRRLPFSFSTSSQQVITDLKAIVGGSWIAGILISVIATTTFLAQTWNEQLEMRCYVLIGLAGMVIVALPALPLKVSKLFPSRLIYFFFALITWVAFFWLVLSKNFSYFSVVGPLIMSASIFWPRRESVGLLARFAFLFVVWQVLSKLAFWTTLDGIFSQSLGTYLGFALGLIITACCVQCDRQKVVSSWMTRGCLFALVLALIFAVGSRIEVDKHHTGFFVGPLQLLREGHWLLWDVPFQYGLLNLSLASLIPAVSPWYSFYLANMACLIAAAISLFLMFGKKHTAGIAFAGILVVVGSLMLPGRAPTLAGPMAVASTGAFRFLWCYILMLTVYQTHAHAERRIFYLWLGNIFWTLSLFWSFESGVYGTGTWLPAFIFFRWSMTNSTESSVRRLCSVASGLGTAALLPIAGAAITYFYYFLNLGHGPDWYSFVEYALTYQNGFGALRANPYGAGWVLIFVFIIFIHLANTAVKRRNWTELAVWTSLSGMMWTTSSYFVSRSHDINVTNLLPLSIAAMAIGWRLKNKKEETSAERVPIELGLGVLLTLFLGITLGTSDWSRLNWKIFSQNRTPSGFREIMPALSPTAMSKMQAVGLLPTDQISLCGNTLGALWPTDSGTVRSFLPFAPAAQINILSPKRELEYLQRFTARNTSDEGWVIFNSKILTEENKNLLQKVNEAYKIENQFTVGDMTLLKYKSPNTVKSL
jgi:hypothetical protein